MSLEEKIHDLQKDISADTDTVLLLIKKRGGVELKITNLIKLIITTPYNPRNIDKYRHALTKLNNSESNILIKIKDTIARRDKNVRDLRRHYVSIAKKTPLGFVPNLWESILTQSFSLLSSSREMLGKRELMTTQWTIELELAPRGNIQKTAIEMTTGMVNKVAVFVKVYHKLDYDRWFPIKTAYAAMKELRHPNILPINGSPYETVPFKIAFQLSPFIHTPTLHEALFPQDRSDKIAFNFPQKINMCRQVFEALSFLHSKEIVHGNLKLKNIVLLKDYNVKISDGGVPSAYDNLMDHWEKSHTLEFMAPEVFEDDCVTIKPRTKESDMWSLGILMLVLLTEKLPYSTVLTAKDMVKAIKKRELPSYDMYKEKNSRLHNLLETALDKNPKARTPNNNNFLQKIFFDHQKMDKAASSKNAMELSVWDYIIAKAATGMNEEALALYSKLSPRGEPIRWPDLLNRLQTIVDRDNIPVYSTLKLKYENLDDCLRLCFAPGSSSETAASTKVHAKEYNLVVKSFPTESLSDFLIFLMQIVEEPWFFGFISREDSNKALNEAYAKFKRPIYLVRLSTNNGSIVISYLPPAAKQIEHVSLESPNVASLKDAHFRSKGLNAYLQALVKDLKVEPLLNSPYRPFNPILKKKK
eukprot:TRINITY_DN6038_c0_g1_i3.p1 TRINITY_DN6038_c0_g1~~TRINITY_DN6038_c0_g1_i3.p1  ORF type:complete len:643 (-),score=89.52 TRINITY_DN6038_c0_g1_i3:48-1976(-)